jgi:histidinol-phosphate aminotransferase
MKSAMDEGLVAPNIAAIVPYVPGKPIEELERELHLAPGDSIKLASNENPLGPSPRAVEAARAALGQAHLYPDGAAWALRRALAERYSVSTAEVAVGAGSNELIDLLVRTFCGPNDEVLTSECTFLCYELSCRAAGVPLRTVPLRDFTYDLDALAEAVGPRSKLIFIANPNNPTGTYVGRAAFERFLDRLPARPILVMDEAYFEYVSAGDFPDGMRYRERRPQLVVLRTFSKVYGLAGLRIGYGIAPAEMVSYLDRVRTPFNTSAVAQVAALAALSDDEHVARSRDVNESGKTTLVAELRKMGVEVVPSQANFVLCRVRRPAAEIFQELLRGGVIVRPMGAYGLLRHLRVTIGTAEQNRRFLAALRPLL